MSKKIKVIIKQPGRAPYSTYISNTLKNLQNTVGGYIETVTLAEDLVMICNEEGVINDMPYNCTVCGVQIFGPLIFAGVKDDEFDSLGLSFNDFKALFKFLWRENECLTRLQTD